MLIRFPIWIFGHGSWTCAEAHNAYTTAQSQQLCARSVAAHVTNLNYPDAEHIQCFVNRSGAQHTPTALLSTNSTPLLSAQSFTGFIEQYRVQER